MAVVALGVVPESDLASAAGLETGIKGAIVTDTHMRTSDPNVYAAGDVTGHSMLAHTAVREAEVARKNRANLNIDMLGTYGFMEMNGGYCAQADKGWDQWSNFTMTPLFHIKDSLLPKRLYRIKNQNKHSTINKIKKRWILFWDNSCY